MLPELVVVMTRLRAVVSGTNVVSMFRTMVVNSVTTTLLTPAMLLAAVAPPSSDNTLAPATRLVPTMGRAVMPLVGTVMTVWMEAGLLPLIVLMVGAPMIKGLLAVTSGSDTTLPPTRSRRSLAVVEPVNVLAMLNDMAVALV